MHQTIALAEEVYKCTEVDNFDDFAFVDRIFFRLCHNRVDHVIGCFDAITIRAGDFDHAFVVDIDFSAGDFNDFTDHFTTRADNFTDLVSWDLHGFNTRSVYREFLCARDRFAHFTQDMQTTSFGLRQGFFHNVLRNAGHFDVHLQ